jgi:hypothetical protein
MYSEMQSERKAAPTIQYEKPIGPERPPPKAPKVIPERTRAQRAVAKLERTIAAPKKREPRGLHGFRKRAEATEAKFARVTRRARAQVGPKRPRRRGGRKGAGWAKTHFKARALKGAAAGRRTSRGRTARGFGLRSWFSKRGRR